MMKCILSKQQCIQYFAKTRMHVGNSTPLEMTLVSNIHAATEGEVFWRRNFQKRSVWYIECVLRPEQIQISQSCCERRSVSIGGKYLKPRPAFCRTAAWLLWSTFPVYLLIRSDSIKKNTRVFQFVCQIFFQVKSLEILLSKLHCCKLKKRYNRFSFGFLENSFRVRHWKLFEKIERMQRKKMSVKSVKKKSDRRTLRS